MDRYIEDPVVSTECVSKNLEEEENPEEAAGFQLNCKDAEKPHHSFANAQAEVEEEDSNPKSNSTWKPGGLEVVEGE